MKRSYWSSLFLVALAAQAASSVHATTQAKAAVTTPAGEGLTGWLNWRGPAQNGSSPETDLFDTLTLDGEHHLWSYPLAGRGTPVIAHGRVYTLAYESEGPEHEEVLLCLDEDTGELLWEKRWSDYLTDVIYTRYAIGSPTVDPATGNVFAMTGAGLLHAFTPDGELLWEVPMMETLGRLSFPNGRVGAPLIVGDLVIIHFIFAAWGRDFGPARDRFFAFDKSTGQVVWGCTPGGPPKDSSFSMPVVERRGGRTLFYAGLGGGHLVCVDAMTGDPVWRYPFSIGGINSSALLYGDNLIAIHGKENLDSSVIGRMASLKLGQAPDDGGVLAGVENWRQDLVAFTSSPTLVGKRVYATTLTGDLNCVDADTGKVLWHQKLGPDQLHASPLAADGKLYVPMTNGSFYVIRPSDTGAEILDHEQLAGSCLGAPAVANGRVYVHTTDRLYCFGERRDGGAPTWEPWPKLKPGPPVRLQLVPADVTFRQSERVPFEVRRLDANGTLVDVVDPAKVAFKAPPFIGTDGGVITAKKAGVAPLTATYDGLTADARLRMVPDLPIADDFEATTFDQDDGAWAYPPGHWLGGREKWMIAEHDGKKVAARKMENPLFQRTMTLIGHPDDSNYTVSVDIKADGNRRSMADGGVVNQRYLIRLRGNYQELEVSSNEEHLKVGVPYKWKVGTWYRLVTRVDLQDDGTATVRAKVWPRDEAEPADWTIEVEDPHGHTHGAAGIYGFTPQSRFTVLLDNFTVTPND